MEEDQGGWPPTDSESAVQQAPTGLPLLPPVPMAVPSFPPPPEPPTPPWATTADDLSVASTGAVSKGRAKVGLMIGLVVLVGAIAGGVVFATHSGTSPPAIQTPTEANSDLYAAAMASGSFHYVVVSSGTDAGHAVTSTQNGDNSRTEGVQYNTDGPSNSEVIVINSMAYMRANLAMMENAFGYSSSEAAPYVGRWIAFAPTDSPYSSIAAGVTTGSTWGNSSVSPSDLLPHTPVSVSNVSTFNGVSVQSVQYSLHGTNQAAHATYSGSEAILFSAAKPHLPANLTEQLSLTANHQPSHEVLKVTFSRWGEPVTVTAPTDSIPYSTLPAPTTPT
jgi:hypothetical protein